MTVKINIVLQGSKVLDSIKNLLVVEMDCLIYNRQEYSEKTIFQIT